MSPRLTVITGPMSAGKTTEMLRRVGTDRAYISVCKILARGKFGVRTHSGHDVRANLVSSLSEALIWAAQPGRFPDDPPDTWVIEEAQWWPCEQLIEAIDAFLQFNDSTQVIVCGLYSDRRGYRFPFVPRLRDLCGAYMSEFIVLTKECETCKKPATGQCLRNPNDIDGVGGMEKYRVTCEDCRGKVA